MRSLLVFSCSSFWMAISKSSMSFLMTMLSPSSSFFCWVASILACSISISLFPASTSATSKSFSAAHDFCRRSVYSPKLPCSDSSCVINAFFSSCNSLHSSSNFFLGLNLFHVFSICLIHSVLKKIKDFFHLEGSNERLGPFEKGPPTPRSHFEVLPVVALNHQH